MSFRQVIVKEAKYISLKESSIIVQKDDEDIKIPIEDVAIIVLENNASTITVNLINKCTENNIILITCNHKKLPQSIIMPYSNHYRFLENTYKQLEYTTVKKQNLWRDIIKMKISNQKEVLRLVDENNVHIEALYQLRDEVIRNDSTNREALAARVFFSAMYGDDFRRFVDDKINSALNYGFSVLVSSIARQLVSYGLDPKLGIWHSSKSNNLNLAYDLVEPFRPIVDYYVHENYEYLSDDLSPKIRRGLVSLLNANVFLDDTTYRLQNAIELYVKRFMLIIRKEHETMHNVTIKKVNFYEL